VWDVTLDPLKGDTLTMCASAKPTRDAPGFPATGDGPCTQWMLDGTGGYAEHTA
jgi:hypothetical protein